MCFVEHSSDAGEIIDEMTPPIVIGWIQCCAHGYALRYARTRQVPFPPHVSALLLACHATMDEFSFSDAAGAFPSLEMCLKCGCLFSEPDCKAPLARMISYRTRRSSKSGSRT